MKITSVNFLRNLRLKALVQCHSFVIVADICFAEGHQHCVLGTWQERPHNLGEELITRASRTFVEVPTTTMQHSFFD